MSPADYRGDGVRPPDVEQPVILVRSRIKIDPEGELIVRFCQASWRCKMGGEVQLIEEAEVAGHKYFRPQQEPRVFQN